MKTETYSMSFTAGGLLRLESVKVAVLYLELLDWHKVREKVFEGNLLQARTINSLSRVYKEVCSRLKTLSMNELKLLVEGATQDQKSLLWIAVCRRYRFIRDFAVEVIRERHLTLSHDLRYEDYDAFMNMKAEWHEEIDRLKPTTRKKLRQVLFKMLREANLLADGNTINPSVLSSQLMNIILHSKSQDILVFPMVDPEMAELGRSA